MRTVKNIVKSRSPCRTPGSDARDELELAVDQAIAACDGDLRATSALVVCQRSAVVRAMGSSAHSRKIGPVCLCSRCPPARSNNCHSLQPAVNRSKPADKPALPIVVTVLTFLRSIVTTASG